MGSPVGSRTILIAAKTSPTQTLCLIADYRSPSGAIPLIACPPYSIIDSYRSPDSPYSPALFHLYWLENYPKSRYSRRLIPLIASHYNYHFRWKTIPRLSKGHFTSSCSFRDQLGNVTVQNYKPYETIEYSIIQKKNENNYPIIV